MKEREHECDATVKVCSCGHRWQYQTTYSNGIVVYCDKWLKDKFILMYGEPEIPFVRVAK